MSDFLFAKAKTVILFNMLTGDFRISPKKQMVDFLVPLHRQALPNEN
jgi:hypothetical protein